jgi:ribonuclease HI
MILHASTDGASRGNPGESGIGIVVRDEQGETLLSTCGYIGLATNNVAEYSALLALLKLVSRWPCTRLIVNTDSELMVKQIRGEYRVKNQNLKKYFQRVHGMLASAPYTLEIRHVPREENKEADRLANLGIDTKKRLRA